MRRLSGEELRAWRKKHGLTQAELAWLLGVSQSAIGKWETGDRKIPPFLSFTLSCLEREFLEGGHP
ncbi:MAG TPA: XRE family transcriptional regulator [Thermosulfurimonas dismutans]|uniref:XRE family transcriptional regulator n=1 Tax=Thermosulfurimonas dismutans TaxID=999894 RepID=A0A7C3CPC3_9BACT|nr:XRE family transcriptional regulator [Thermosulfurimonas dismutans]